MNAKKFSVLDVVLIGFKTMFDNIRLFIAAFFAKLAVYGACIFIIALLDQPFVRKIWEVIPKIKVMNKYLYKYCPGRNCSYVVGRIQRYV